jgi:Protein of unknown function (DUF2587)
MPTMPHDESSAPPREVADAEPVPPGDMSGEAEGGPAFEAIQHPAKVMRIASMARTLLEEVRQAGLDEASRGQLKKIYETSVKELADVLSEDLSGELERLTIDFDKETPSDAELRVAHAQLVGWLEGLFHGIQAMLFAQQMESRQALEQMRRGLPAPGQPGPDNPTGGTYL